MSDEQEITRVMHDPSRPEASFRPEDVGTSVESVENPTGGGDPYEVVDEAVAIVARSTPEPGTAATMQHDASGAATTSGTGASGAATNDDMASTGYHYDVTGKTVEQVLTEFVKDDPARARWALSVEENAETPRVTLVERLRAIAGS